MTAPDGETPDVPLVAILDSLPALIGYFDDRRRLVIHNRAYGEWAGRPDEDFRGRTLGEVFGDEAAAVLDPYARQALAGERTEFEAVVPYPTGRREVQGTYVPHRASDGRVRGFSVLVRDVTRERAAGRRWRFLADASELLGASLDYDATLDAAVRLAVPEIADWIGVDLLEDGRSRRVAVATVDPAHETLVRELDRKYPPDLDAATGLPRVLRTGQPELLERITDDDLRAAARDERHLEILRTLGLHSAAIVPLAIRGRVIGALWLASTTSGRRFDADDVELALRLADRVATAIENARLYGAARATSGQ